MKIFFVIMTTFLVQVSASTSAQQLTLKAERITLKQVFTQIRKQTGYTMFYESDLVNKAKPISIDVKDEPLTEVLDAVLEDQNLEYRINNRTIRISAKEKSIIDKVKDYFQSIDVPGKVVGEDGQPLAGATVQVKGGNSKTNTDVNGRFTLKQVQPDDIIIISYVGYEDMELKASSIRNSLPIVLKISTNNLQEVTINKGYYQEKQRFSVGNAVHVDAKIIEQQPVQNPLLTLAGRVPGLEVTQLTGLNGGGVKVRIQGQNSIASGLDPLIVVDGLPYYSQLFTSFNQLNGNVGGFESILKGGSPLNFINPDDIESIDILKDADATSIYGSRAANGAILITTKKGKPGKTKLSAGFSQGTSRIARYIDMLNTRQYLDMRYEGYRNDGITALSTQAISSANYDLKLWDTTRYTNWQKELLGESAINSKLNATLSGGSSNIQYYVGLTYSKNTTVFSGDNADQSGTAHFSISGNSDNQRLRLQLSGSYMYNQNKLPGVDLTEIAIQMAPNVRLLNADGTLNWAPNASGSSSLYNNPLAQVYYRGNTFNTQTLVSNLDVSYKLLKGLTFKSNIGYNTLLSRSYTFSKLEYDAPEFRSPTSRKADFGTRIMSSWNAEPQINYSGKLWKGNIDALIGTTIQNTSQSYLALEGSGAPTDQLIPNLLAATTISVIYNSSSTNKYNAGFGRIAYRSMDKYLLNFDLRRDGSNRFGEANRFHNFYSIGAGWIFSEEKLLKAKLPALSFGKLRMSYGLTGNDQIEAFSYLTTYALTRPAFPYQGVISLDASKIPNPNLQWEETRKWQMGMDLGFFDGRINLSGTFVRNRSNNQLVNYVLPTLTGASSYTVNWPALIQNTSWEFLLNTINFKRKNFSWNTNFNLTIPRNKLLSFPDIEKTPYASGTNGVIIGEPLGVQKVAMLAGVSPSTGKYMYYDLNGNVVPNAVNDFLASTLSKYYGGVVNNISYKNITLDFLIQFVNKTGTKDTYYAADNSIFPGNFSNGGLLSNQPVTVLDRWQKPGDNSTVAKFSNNAAGLGSPPTVYTKDASYIRLKNIALSYTIPNKWIQSVKVQNMRLFINCQNVWTITRYTGLDPESGGLGMPPLRTIVFGGKVDF